MPPEMEYDPQQDASNPHKRKSLWAGNIQPQATENEIKELFGKYGCITSVRIMPDRYCAFINFASADGATRAMNNLQGHLLHGYHLLLRFPDNQATGDHK